MDSIAERSEPVGWSLRELLARSGVQPVYPSRLPERIVTHLTDDSRSARRGSCFVAVRGTGTDGHKFIDAAVKAGADVIVAERGICASDSVAWIEVRDSRDAVARLAATFYGLREAGPARMRLIGVTGTNGKTTITYLLRSIFQQAGQKASVIGTIEYDLVGERRSASLTTPGAIQLCELLATAQRNGAQWAAMEVSSHALDQRRCAGLDFDAAIFSNLTGDHLDYHHTMEEYARAKMRLFEGLGGGAKAVVNRDDPMGALFAESSAAPVTSYGTDSSGAEVSGRITSMDRLGTRFLLRTPTFEAPVHLRLIGRHNVMNALAAAAAAWALGAGEDAILAGLERVGGVPGRLQRVEPEGSAFSVVVDYAHTDDALRNVLTALRPVTRGRVICVFGCGGDRDRSKRPRMAKVVGELADAAIVTSDNPRSENPQAIIEEILPGFALAGGGRIGRCEVEVEADRAAAIGRAIEMARTGDTVLIAGKGHENYQLVGGQVLHFDDVEVASRRLRELRACCVQEARA